VFKKKTVISFLNDQLSKQRKQIFLWAPVAVACGIIAYFVSDNAIAIEAVGGALFLSLLAVAKSYHLYSKTGLNRWLLTLLVSMAGLLFCVGYGVSDIRTQSIDNPILSKDMPIITIEGTIEKLVALDGGKAKRVILRDVMGEGIEKPLRVRLKTYHFKGDDWKNGDRVSVRAKLRAPSGPVMPGGFDFRFKAKYERISAVGYTIADASILVRSKANSNHIQSFRDHVGARLYQNMDANTAGIAQALLTGERAGIAKDDTEALRVSGLAHLLAISGLHIGLVAGCMFFFVRLFLALIPGLALRYPIKKWAAACAIITAFSYMVLAGATVPTVRAFIMTSLVLFAVILDRSALNMRLVALAAIIVMVTTPEAVIGPSFVLSFAAVGALIAFYQGAGRQWVTNANAYKPLYRPFYYLIGVIVTTLVATFATAPFSVMFFNRFAVYSVLSNIGAMPLMGFIVMPFGLLSTLIISTGFDIYAWPIMAWGIDHIVDIAHRVTSMKGADLYLPSFDTFETFLICFGFIWLILWRGVLKWFGLAFMIMGCLLSWSYAPTKIFISEKMDAVMIVDKSMDKPYVIGKMSKYLKSNWLGSEGFDPDVDVFQYQYGDKIDQSIGYCDDLSCNLNIEGRNIVIIHNPNAMQLACHNADIMISSVPKMTRFCPDTYMIDRFDVWRNGAMTITFKGGRYNVQSVGKDN
jgi:competence protein ComEC